MGQGVLRRIAAFFEALLLLIGALIEVGVGKLLRRGAHRGTIPVRYDVIDPNQAKHSEALAGENCLHDSWNLSQVNSTMLTGRFESPRLV